MTYHLSLDPREKGVPIFIVAVFTSTTRYLWLEPADIGTHPSCYRFSVTSKDTSIEQFLARRSPWILYIGSFTLDTFTAFQQSHPEIFL